MRPVGRIKGMVLNQFGIYRRKNPKELGSMKSTVANTMLMSTTRSWCHKDSPFGIGGDDESQRVCEGYRATARKRR
jgi:hypothetical protein